MYNTEFLVETRVYDFSEDHMFEYREPLKIFGFTISKGGFIFYGRSFDINNLSNNKFVKNNIVYIKPFVFLKYVNGSGKRYYFNTINEAKEFESQFTNTEKWIK